MGKSEIKYLTLSQEDFVNAGAFDLRMAIEALIVTATSTQAPLMKAAWIKKGAFYSHIGGWEDENAVVEMADKFVCDDWETVKHRTQTVSRMYKDGLIIDDFIYGNLIDILSGKKPGRESDDEFIYFDAVGLAHTDVSIACAMYQKAKEVGVGSDSFLQKKRFSKKISREKSTSK